MLALNHATLASATALGLSLYFDRPFFLPLLILVIFAGVFPDIDHPGSELGRYFKPLGKVLPHRGITHSILGTSIFVALLYFLLGQNQWFTYFLIFGAFFGNYLLEKILEQHIGSLDEMTHDLISDKQARFLLKLLTMVINIVLFVLLVLVWNRMLRDDILILLVIGYVAHIIGDFVTIEGVPLFYPIKKKFGLKLFRTGSWVESLIGVGLFALNIYLIYQSVLVFKIDSAAYWLQYIKF
jgi:membrane-bound metal-dependent hydrolase YbcI (DUF457 family)